MTRLCLSMATRNMRAFMTASRTCSMPMRAMSTWHRSSLSPTCACSARARTDLISTGRFDFPLNNLRRSLGGAFFASSVPAHPDAFCEKPQGFPIDAGGDLEGHQRVSEEKPEQRLVGEGLRLAGEGCIEE